MIFDIDENAPLIGDIKEIKNGQCINCSYSFKDDDDILFVRTGDTQRLIWWHATKGTHCKK